MKKVAIRGLVFAIFLLSLFVPVANADNAVHKAGTLHHEHKQRVKQVRAIRHRQKSRNKGFLESPTAWERRIAKEKRQEQQEEKKLLLQKEHEEDLKRRELMQEERLKLKEQHKLHIGQGS